MQVDAGSRPSRICVRVRDDGTEDLTGAVRRVDVADAGAVEAFAAEVVQTLGPIDLWINNAGVLGPVGPIRDTSNEHWRRCVEINLFDVLFGSRAFLAHRSGHATLINIASRVAANGAAGLAAYSATKSAVVSLTPTLCSRIPTKVPSWTSRQATSQTTVQGRNRCRRPGVSGPYDAVDSIGRCHDAH